MAKTFYSDYITHAMRYFVRHRDPEGFTDDVSRHNWTSCDIVYQNLSPEDQKLLLQVYSLRCLNTSEAVAIYHRHNPAVSLDHIWDVIKTTERDVARARGLIT